MIKFLITFGINLLKNRPLSILMLLFAFLIKFNFKKLKTELIDAQFIANNIHNCPSF
jgi:hypothetical protein